MPNNLLNILKFFLIAGVWLFFIRAMRAVWVESRTPVSVASEANVPRVPSRSGAGSSPAPRSAGGTSGGDGEESTFLVILEPPELAGESYELDDDESIIGRASGCAVSIEADTFISHLNSRIFKRGRELWIEDLGSTNGTYVNSKRLTSPVPLRIGDKVHVGHTAFEVTR